MESNTNGSRIEGRADVNVPGVGGGDFRMNSGSDSNRNGEETISDHSIVGKSPFEGEGEKRRSKDLETWKQEVSESPEMMSFELKAIATLLETLHGLPNKRFASLGLTKRKLYALKVFFGLRCLETNLCDLEFEEEIKTITKSEWESRVRWVSPPNSKPEESSNNEVEVPTTSGPYERQLGHTFRRRAGDSAFEPLVGIKILTPTASSYVWEQMAVQTFENDANSYQIFDGPEFTDGPSYMEVSTQEPENILGHKWQKW